MIFHRVREHSVLIIIGRLFKIINARIFGLSLVEIVLQGSENQMEIYTLNSSGQSS